MGGTGHRLVAAADAVAAAVAAALVDVGPDTGVVIALSGGPDSTVLAEIVAKQRPTRSVTAVHVRHGLRDDDARDAAAAAATAQRLDVDYVEMAVIVGVEDGLEADARRARYAALAEAAITAGAGVVVTAHTADDQAETVLLNIARGAGVTGASGMPASRPLARGVQLRRPLLEVRRSAVRVLAERLRADGFDIVDDPMNNDSNRRRTRVRAEALPALQRLTGGGTDPVVALNRLAAAAADDDAALRALADQWLDAELRRWGPVTAVAFDALVGAPRAIGTRVLRRLLTTGQDAGPGGTPQLPSSETVHRLLRLAPGRSLVMGGLVAMRSAGWLTISPPLTAPTQSLPLEAVATVPGVDLVVERTDVAIPGLLPFWAPRGAAAVVPAPRGVLCLRTCRRDDVIATPTPRRLTAALRASVPAAARALVAVIADDSGPVWIPGVAVRAGLRDQGAGYLRLAARGYAATERGWDAGGHLGRAAP